MQKLYPDFYSLVVIVLTGLTPLYIVRIQVGGLPTNLFEVLAMITIVIGLLRPSTRYNLHHFIHALPKTITISVLLFIAAAILSTILTRTNPLLGPTAFLHSLGQLKSLIIIPIALATLVGSLIYAQPGLRTYVIQALLTCGLVVALLGLSQLGHLPRSSSLYDVPNSLALFLVPVSILSVFSPHRLYRLCGLVMIAAIIATQSISAVVALSVTLALGLFLWPPSVRVRRQVIIAFVLGLLITSGYFTFTGRLGYFFSPIYNHTITTSLAVRWQLWRIAADLITDQSLLGVGLGQFEPAYQQKLHERFIEFERTKYVARQLSGGSKAAPLSEFVFRDPHNLILSFWLNLGLLGLVSFSWLTIFILKKSFSQSKNNTNAQGLILALIATLIFGLTDTMYWKNDLASLYWIMLVLAHFNTDRRV